MDAVAASLQQKHGKPLFPGLGKYDGWSRESYKVATTKVYPVTLFRRVKPTDAYFATALTEAEARRALAGYGLGELLNPLLRLNQMIRLLFSHFTSSLSSLELRSIGVLKTRCHELPPDCSLRGKRRTFRI